ncbi:unnamed protein product [Diplocarpon coronariae]
MVASFLAHDLNQHPCHVAYGSRVSSSQKDTYLCLDGYALCPRCECPVREERMPLFHAPTTSDCWKYVSEMTDSTMSHVPWNIPGSAIPRDCALSYACGDTRLGSILSNGHLVEVRWNLSSALSQLHFDPYSANKNPILTVQLGSDMDRRAAVLIREILAGEINKCDYQVLLTRPLTTFLSGLGIKHHALLGFRKTVKRAKSLWIARSLCPKFMVMWSTSISDATVAPHGQAMPSSASRQTPCVSFRSRPLRNDGAQLTAEALGDMVDGTAMYCRLESIFWRYRASDGTQGTANVSSGTTDASMLLESFQVTVEEHPLPKLEHPADALMKGTTAAICCSDLHMYQGRTAAQGGLCFGPAIMEIAIEAGAGLSLLKKGERVAMPFNVTDGRCRNCEEARAAFCTGVNPYILISSAALPIQRPSWLGEFSDFAGGARGDVDFNCLPLPAGTVNEADFILRADISPAGWPGVVLVGFRPGESIGVFGAGSVGLVAANGAVLRGASQVYVVDLVPGCLAATEKTGCVAVDVGTVDGVQDIIQRNGGLADRSVDAAGSQASAQDGTRVAPSIVLENCIRVTRPTGSIGAPGLEGRSDPGLTIGTGQCNVKADHRYLRDMSISGRAKPSFVVSHGFAMDEAPAAYTKFDRREDGGIRRCRFILTVAFERTIEQAGRP